MTAVLECTDLAAGYGGIAVVRGLSLAVEQGQVLALLGPNGAGKTTTLLTLAGILPPIAGTINALGAPIPRGRPHLLSRRGISLVPEDRALFPSLTTLENIRTGQRRGGPSAKELLDSFPALVKRVNVRAGALSGGEQQMLVMARALAARPKALLLDEMSTGLAPTIVADLLQLVRRLADEQGTAVILVEQHVRLALKVADEALVLVHGDPVVRGPARMLLDDHKLLEDAYLGRDVVAAH